MVNIDLLQRKEKHNEMVMRRLTMTCMKDLWFI